MIRFRVFLGSEVCTECFDRGRLDKCLRTACVLAYERGEPRGSRRRHRRMRRMRSASAYGGESSHVRSNDQPPQSNSHNTAQGRQKGSYTRPYVRLGKKSCGCDCPGTQGRMIIDVTPRPRVIRAWADGSRVPAYILEMHTSHSSRRSPPTSPDVEIDISEETHPSSSTPRRDRDRQPDRADRSPATRNDEPRNPKRTKDLVPTASGPSGSNYDTSRTSHHAQAAAQLAQPAHAESSRKQAQHANPRLSLRDPSYSPKAVPSPRSQRTGYSLRTGGPGRPPSLPLSRAPSGRSLEVDVFYNPVDPHGRIAQALLSSSSSSLDLLATPRSKSSRVSWLKPISVRSKPSITEKIMSKLRTAPPGVAPTLHPSVISYRQQLAKTKGLISEIAFGEANDRELRLKIHKAFSAVEPFAVLDPEYTAVLQSLEYESLKHLSEDLERLLIRWHPVSCSRVCAERWGKENTYELIARTRRLSPPRRLRRPILRRPDRGSGRTPPRRGRRARSRPRRASSPSSSAPELLVSDDMLQCAAHGAAAAQEAGRLLYLISISSPTHIVSHRLSPQCSLPLHQYSMDRPVFMLPSDPRPHRSFWVALHVDESCKKSCDAPRWCNVGNSLSPKDSSS